MAKQTGNILYLLKKWRYDALIASFWEEKEFGAYKS